jgi:hypothetical protein
MNFEWINSENIIPIGLKGKDCYFEINIYEYNNAKYALVSNMQGINKTDLYELIVSVIITIEKNYDIKDIYQIIDNQTFEICKNTNWKNIKFEKNKFNNEYLMLKTDINNFLELFRNVFN